jgi:Kef-type K+ transport system membrane component KefB
MPVHVLFKILGAIVFLGTCTLVVAGFYEPFLDFWNSQDTCSMIFQLGIYILGASVSALGFLSPFLEVDPRRTRELKRDALYVCSTSINLGFIPSFVACMLVYNSWDHGPHHNILAALFWLTLLFAGSICMMRSKSTKRFQGLRVVK